MDPIEKPHPNDVLSGRGNSVNNHNRNYRDRVNNYKIEYATCPSNSEKSKFATIIYKEIKNLNPPGRFLKQNQEKKWIEISEKKAIGKIRQALREGASDIHEVLRTLKKNISPPSTSPGPTVVTPNTPNVIIKDVWKCRPHNSPRTTSKTSCEKESLMNSSDARIIAYMLESSDDTITPKNNMEKTFTVPNNKTKLPPAPQKFLQQYSCDESLDLRALETEKCQSTCGGTNVPTFNHQEILDLRTSLTGKDSRSTFKRTNPDVANLVWRNLSNLTSGGSSWTLSSISDMFESKDKTKLPPAPPKFFQQHSCDESLDLTALETEKCQLTCGGTNVPTFNHQENLDLKTSLTKKNTRSTFKRTNPDVANLVKRDLSNLTSGSLSLNSSSISDMLESMEISGLEELKKSFTCDSGNTSDLRKSIRTLIKDNSQRQSMELSEAVDLAFYDSDANMSTLD